jgi:integrase
MASGITPVEAGGAPKTASAERWVELFPETIRLLRELQPLHVTPDLPVFTTTTGTPIEPKTFSRHWYDCLRAPGIRQRGLYATKDTFVTTALEAGVKIAWLEQTGGGLRDVATALREVDAARGG